MRRAIVGSLSGAVPAAMVLTLVRGVTLVIGPGTFGEVNIHQLFLAAVLLLGSLVSSVLESVIWVFIWLGAGSLLGIMGLDIGVAVRRFLGPFDGRRVAAMIASLAAFLVVWLGLGVSGLLPTAMVIGGFALCAVVLVIIGAIGSAPLPEKPITE